jgi:RNA polymerase sigma factor for flagellar operon FliA
MVEQAPRAIEESIWLDYKNTGSFSAREALILKYAPLVRSLARGYQFKTPPSIEYADLVGYGFLGLMDAIEKFDCNRGVDFSAYARIRINGAIADGVRVERRVPRTAQDKAQRLQHAFNELSAQLLRYPNDLEMANRLGIRIEKYRRIKMELEASSVLSLDDLIASADSQDADSSFIDLLRDEKAVDPLEMSERKDTRRIVIEAIGMLPEREKMILSLYYEEELSMKEIGQVLDITESRVSQIHSEAISRLRTFLSPLLQYQPA